MKSFERVLTAVFTNSETGASVTLTGNHAYSFHRQFSEEGAQIINYYDETTGTYESYNRDCICNLKYTSVKGDEYVKPNCEPLYCDPATTPEP